MSVTASFSVSPKERVVQEALEARLEPSEVLVAFTQCRHNPGGLADKTFWIGLTRQRVLILRKDLPLRIYSIYLPFLQTITYAESGWPRRRNLTLVVGNGTAGGERTKGERIVFSVPAAFSQHSAQIARGFAGIKPVETHQTADKVIGQVADLLELGLLHAAQTLLHTRRAADPVVEINQGGAQLDRLIQNAGAALWVAAGMSVLALLFLLGMAIFGLAKPGLGMLFSLLAIYELAHRQQSRRGLGLALGLLSAGVNLVTHLNSAGLLAALMWLSFAVALVLILAGYPSRRRIVISVCIFLLGFMGAMMLIIATQIPGQGLEDRFLAHSVEASGLEALSRGYSDDFSSNRGWPVHQEADLVTRVDKGKYEVYLKEANTTFYAFPPLNFSPEAGAVAIEIPAAFHDTPGTFGMVCGYHPSTATEESNFYRIEIDPGRQRYAINQQTGTNEQTLLYFNWHALKGLGQDQPVEQVMVRCSGKQISLSVNAVEQVNLQLGETESFTQGKMGLFVSTWEDTGPQGYEVIFRNAHFYEAGE